MRPNDVYFAAKEANEAAAVLMDRSNDWFQTIYSNGYLNKLRTMWQSYHGAYYTDGGIGNDSHSITFGGEQGELVQLPINHIRNLAQHMLNIITSTRPTMQARATNTDYKSLVQTRLANGLLDFYMRDHRLEDFLKTAVEYAIVFGSGYVKLEWNATRGEVYDTDPGSGDEIREGDVEFSNLSPFDVVFDTSAESKRCDWVITRSMKNKYDLIAKFPELVDKIRNIPTIDDSLNSFMLLFNYGKTDMIPVYEFYHNRTEALPDGRYMLYLDSEVILLDSPMPYRNLPVYRIAPAYYLGTNYGYTPMFDLLPTQDAVNSLYSTILTNQTAFGVQSVVVGKNSDLDITKFEGGMQVLEVNNPGEIQPLNLTNTPKEIFEFLQMLEKVMETLSGVNSVARGNPDPNLRSGNALALVQSMTLQFMSGLQQSYVALIEDLGTGIIDVLKDHATVPRIAAITGKNNRSYIKEFKGSDLDNVSRVIVDIGNPLSRCLAKGTEVLMFDGSKKKVEDIQIGEQIMGPDSKSRTVTNVNSGQEMMYEIESKDKHRKVKYGANESHILTLKYCSDDERYNAKKGDIIDITIREYNKLTERQQRLLQGFKVGVEFKEKSLTIPPYILGTWIGDGNKNTTAITTMDAEIFKEWFDYAESIGMQMRTSTSANEGKAKTYHLTSGQANGSSDRNPMMNELRAMELIQNKHIPDRYLRNSRKNRLELLAGLIDTDGSRNGETFVFTQKDDVTASQVCFLAESLGFRVTVHKRPIATSELVKNATGEINVITIGGNTWEIPTRLPRKQAKAKSKARDWNNYGIKVTPVGEGTYYGFTLKEEPHFLLGDFTVTHNTTAGRVEMAEQMLQMGVLKTPEQYFMVIDTGQLDVMTEDTQSQLYLIKDENERLISKKQVRALLTDEHQIHIKEHAAILADSDLRFDEELVNATLQHIQEHIDILSNPAIAQVLMSLGQQPIQPPMPPPPTDQNVPDASLQGQVPETLGGGPVNTALAQQGVLPESLPGLPQVPADVLPNPAMQEMAMGNVKQ